MALFWAFPEICAGCTLQLRGLCHGGTTVLPTIPVPTIPLRPLTYKIEAQHPPFPSPALQTGLERWSQPGAHLAYSMQMRLGRCGSGCRLCPASFAKGAPVLAHLSLRVKDTLWAWAPLLSHSALPLIGVPSPRMGAPMGRETNAETALNSLHLAQSVAQDGS